MGNNFNKDKISNSFNVLASQEEYSKEVLKTEFATLQTECGLKIANNATLNLVFEEILKTLTPITVSTLTGNIINYIDIQIKEDAVNLIFALELMVILLEILHNKIAKEKYDFLIAIYKVQKEKLGKISNNRLKKLFPVNILINIIEWNINIHNTDSVMFTAKSEVKFHIFNLLDQIIHSVLFFEKKRILNENHIIQLKNAFFDNSDVYKFILEASNKLVDLDKVDSFIVKRYFNFILNFQSLLNNQFDSAIAKTDYEKFININLDLITYFLFDRNKFIKANKTKSIEDFLLIEVFSNIIESSDLLEIVYQYNERFKKLLFNIVVYNSKTFLDFLTSFFTNLDYISLETQDRIKVFLIYFLESNNVFIFNEYNIIKGCY